MTNRNLLTCSLALAIAPCLMAQNRHRGNNNRDYPYSAPDQVTQKSFTLGATPLVTVDDLSGDINVVNDGGSDVRFTATEHIMGRSQQDVTQGQKDVHLDVTPSGDTLELYVDGPFRCGNDNHRSSSLCGDHWSWDDRDRGYQVDFTFELHVPTGTAVTLRTVNGDETVTGVHGNYHVTSVNGNVDLEQMGGVGKASTVNGGLKVVYQQNPADDCTFSTVNGKVSLYLKPSLNAAVHYSTVNGSIYTDFPTAEMTSDLDSAARNGMRVWRSGRSHTVEIGHGGPQLHVSTVNGDVFLHAEK